MAQASSGDAAADAATDEKAEPAADADKKDDAKADDKKADDKKADDKAEPAADAKADDKKADEKAEPAADAKADDQKAEPAADDAKAGADKKDDAKAEAGALKDGEYTAEGKGIGGDVPVTVTVKDGKVSEVTVGDNSETQGIGSKAIEQLPEAIVAAGGTEGVDAVSGATITSKAIFSAVEDAVAQASSGDAAADAATDEKAEPAADADKKDDEKAETAADADKKDDAKADDQKAEPAADAKADSTAAVLADGEYTATGKGIGGDVPVTVTVKDGKVSEVTVGDNSETQGIGSKAIEQLPALIVENNGTDGIDGISGATITSKAIFSAVEDCLKQAEAPADDTKAGADKKDDAKAEAGALKDGEYTAEGKGIGGKVPVTVVVKDGAVAEVTVGDNSETQGIGSKAVEQLPALIVEAGGTEGVDGVLRRHHHLQGHLLGRRGRPGPGPGLTARGPRHPKSARDGRAPSPGGARLFVVGFFWLESFASQKRALHHVP